MAAWRSATSSSRSWSTDDRSLSTTQSCRPGCRSAWPTCAPRVFVEDGPRRVNESPYISGSTHPQRWCHASFSRSPARVRAFFILGSLALAIGARSDDRADHDVQQPASRQHRWPRRDCEVTVVNTITASGGTSIVKVRECHGAANDPKADCSTKTKGLSELVTSVTQCNDENGGGGSVRCSVKVTNRFVGIPDPDRRDGQPMRRFGGGGIPLGCDSFPATTTNAATTQCNGSGNGGALVGFTCTASGTKSAARPDDQPVQRLGQWRRSLHRLLGEHREQPGLGALRRPRRRRQLPGRPRGSRHRRPIRRPVSTPRDRGKSPFVSPLRRSASSRSSCSWRRCDRLARHPAPLIQLPLPPRRRRNPSATAGVGPSRAAGTGAAPRSEPRGRPPPRCASRASRGAGLGIHWSIARRAIC